jgi:hypothetical protein
LQWDDGFWCWWTIAESTVWSDRIIVFAPFLDDYLSFLESVEYLPVEKLIPEPDIESFAIAVLPW